MKNIPYLSEGAVLFYQDVEHLFEPLPLIRVGGPLAVKQLPRRVPLAGGYRQRTGCCRGIQGGANGGAISCVEPVACDSGARDFGHDCVNFGEIS